MNVLYSRLCSLMMISVTALCAQTGNSLLSGRKLAYFVPDALNDFVSDLPVQAQGATNQVIQGNLVLSPLNSGLAVELSNLPASSSASAFRYVFDPGVGAYVPTQQSLGPILTERSETIGKDKFYLAVTYQRFQFDHSDNLDLRKFQISVPLQFGPVSEEARAAVTISLSVNEVSANLTYGVTPWMDVSYAFTLLSNSIGFRMSGSVPPATATVSEKASSSGLGDGVARVKAKIFDHEGLALAFATDIRVPTGDELNLLGSGAFGIKPFLIASYATHAVSPHLNIGYQRNGKSYLASPSLDHKQQLPSQAIGSLGVDIAASKRLTIAADVLDEMVINGPVITTSSAPGEPEAYSSIRTVNRTRHEVNSSVGLKASLRRDLVLTGNLLFSMNQAGLRARVVPLVGLSYLF